MTEFENIVIGKSAIPSLAVTVILMIAIPVIFFICWRKKQKQQTKIGYFIAVKLYRKMKVSSSAESV